jgi:hypothetical protein
MFQTIRTLGSESAGDQGGPMKRHGRHLLGCSVLALASAADAGETIVYGYDALGRLIATSSTDTVNPGATSSIGYDAAGNRSIYAMSVSGAPAFSVSDAAAVEGGGLVFTVVKNGSGAASVGYVTANGSAGAGGDYAGVGGSLSFAAGESSKTVAVATIDDPGDEPNETLSLNLSGPSAGATVADAQGIGTIFDNDEPPPPPPPPPPSFSINDASATEGGIIVFTVTKTGATTGSFAVGFGVSDGTAYGSYTNNYSGEDYYLSSANVTFGPADVTKTISIYTIQDAADEANETLLLNLTGPTGGATITDGQGIGTIVDDDDPPPPPPPGNLPPIAVNDFGSQKVCTIKTYDVLANDSDPEGAGPLTLIASTHPSFAIVNNQIQVESSSFVSGTSTTYTVRDSGNATATATLTVELTAGRCNQ